MDYDLAIDGAPETVPGGTAILLLHPSTGETDRIDTQFPKGATDHFLVVSTRTTAREVKQKLEYYDVDESKAIILDALSVDRGYSRRAADNIYYVRAPDDVDDLLQHAETFLREHDGHRRISFDSITELAYYADEEQATDALRRLVDLLQEFDAIGLFHVDSEVHDDAAIARFQDLCDGVLLLDEDGSLTASF